jgi:hypothetical protein
LTDLIPTGTWLEVLVCEIEFFDAEGAAEDAMISRQKLEDK